MKRRILLALIGLNVLLILMLTARLSRDNTASAQVRRPAEYIMIPGEVSGGSSAVVYLIDTTNGLLGAMTYDDSQRKLNTMPPIDLAHVFETGPAPGVRTVPGAGGGAGAGAGVGPGMRRP